MPLLPLNSTLGQHRAAHLLRRAAFGGTKADIDTFSGMTPAEAVSQLFANTPFPAPPVDPALGSSWIGTAPGDGEDDSSRTEYVVRWFLGRLMGVDDLPVNEIVREKVVLFMHTYFTTMKSKVSNSRALYYQNELFRRFAFDGQDAVEGPRDFRTLVKKVSLDNAMLQFLDGKLNVKGSPNENYAREMLELYTIGRGLEGNLPETGTEGDYYNYTEQDVRAAANILTGYDFDKNFSVIDPETGLPTAKIKGGAAPSQHENDASLKQFSERFDNQVISADPALLINDDPTPESMADELDQLVAMIFGKEETARHICRKIYRFYVHYEITPELDDDIIADMADRFINGGYRIQPVLEALFTSTHFYEAIGGVDDDKFGAIIKSPLDLVATTFRFFEIDMPSYQSNIAAFYESAGELLDVMEKQGMQLYEPSEVAGYPAYHQFPRYNRNWISTNYLVTRYNFIRELLEMNDMFYFNSRAFISQRFTGEWTDARQLILALCPCIFPMASNLSFTNTTSHLTPERLNYFLYAFLTANQYTEAEWTALTADPATNYLEIESLLHSLLNSILQTPEYQLF